MFNKNVNFSTGFQYRLSLKKQQFLTYSPKNDNKQPSGMLQSYSSHKSYFTVTKVLLGVGPILMTGLKYWLIVKSLQIIFYLRLSYENKSKSSTEWMKLSEF